MRKLFTIIVYTLVVLIVGRNLEMLPRFRLFQSTTKVVELDTNTLKDKVALLTKGLPGTYGIYFSDMEKPYNFGLNERGVFTGASINKVMVVAALYNMAQKGKIDLDDKITLQKEDIQDYGTGSMRYADPGTVYSIRTLARLALTQSDNTAAHLLGNLLGLDNVQKTIEGFGLSQTNMTENKTSAYDVYLIFRKIYKGEIADKANTKELLGFMQNTDIEDRLPASLPDSARVYHKTGDTIGGIHDAGIISAPQGTFFLGVLTSDIGDNEEKTKRTISAIARMVMDEYL